METTYLNMGKLGNISNPLTTPPPLFESYTPRHSSRHSRSLIPPSKNHFTPERATLEPNTPPAAAPLPRTSRSANCMRGSICPGMERTPPRPHHQKKTRTAGSPTMDTTGDDGGGERSHRLPATTIARVCGVSSKHRLTSLAKASVYRLRIAQKCHILQVFTVAEPRRPWKTTDIAPSTMSPKTLLQYPRPHMVIMRCARTLKRLNIA